MGKLLRWLGAGDDDASHGVGAHEHLAQLLRQAGIADDGGDFRMVNNVANLVIHQLFIQRGKNRALAGGTEHYLQVLGAIPHKAAHTLIAGDTQFIVNGVGERGGAGSDIAEGNFLGRIEFRAGALTVPGGNRGVPVHRGAVFQNAGQGEGDIHHRGKHASTVAVSWCGRCVLCVILVRDW